MIKVLFPGKEIRERRRETILHPPDGVEYNTMIPLDIMRPDFAISKTPFKIPFFKKMMLNTVSLLKIPNIRYILPKYLKNVDLIHSPGQLILNKIPWVVEIDNVACLAFYNLKILKKRINLIKKFLKLQNCKAILCISEAAKKSVINTFRDEKIEKKCNVIYPYVEINPYRKERKDEKILLLSCNTKFFMKGTREVLASFEILNQKYKNLELWIISNTPKEFLEKYSRFKNIKFFPAKFKKEDLYKKFLSQCDIFVQPSYQDSFGLIYLEVMASGKPIVSTDIFAIPEMLIDGFNGFLIKAPFYMYNPDFTLKEEYFPISVVDTENEFYKKVNGEQVVKDLVKKLSILIENEELRQKMEENALTLIKNKFSDILRREKLKSIYQASLL